MRSERRERARRATVRCSRAALSVARARAASWLAFPLCIDPPLPLAAPPGRHDLAPPEAALQLGECAERQCRRLCPRPGAQGGALAAGTPAASFRRESASICVPPAAQRARKRDSDRAPVCVDLRQERETEKGSCQSCNDEELNFLLIAGLNWQLLWGLQCGMKITPRLRSNLQSAQF